MFLNIGISILEVAQHNELKKKKKPTTSLHICAQTKHPFKPSLSTFLAVPHDKLSNAIKCKQSKAAAQAS